MLEITFVLVMSCVVGLVGCDSPLARDTDADGSSEYEVDHSNPSLYLQSGAQTNLNQASIDLIETEINLEMDRMGITEIDSSSLDGVQDIYDALYGKYGVVTDEDGDGDIDADDAELFSGGPTAEFRRYGSIQWGGSESTGENATVNEILATQNIEGCTSSAIVMAAILRHYGFPTIIVQTVSVDWARNYDGETGHVGHVWLEVYIGDMNAWVLVDSIHQNVIGVGWDPADNFWDNVDDRRLAGDIQPNLSTVSDYDPNNRWIHVPSYPTALAENYVFAKGIDNYEMELDTPTIYAAMEEFAAEFDSMTPDYYELGRQSFTIDGLFIP